MDNPWDHPDSPQDVGMIRVWHPQLTTMILEMVDGSFTPTVRQIVVQQSKDLGAEWPISFRYDNLSHHLHIKKDSKGIPT